MKRGGKVLIIVVSCLVVVVLAMIGVVKGTSAWARTLTWDDPSLAGIADGAYHGEKALSMPFGTAAANPSVSVIVHVADHRYAAIDLVKPEALAPSMARLAKRVVDNQTLKLDAVSGATVTDSAFLMAVASAVKAQ